MPAAYRSGCFEYCRFPPCELLKGMVFDMQNFERRFFSYLCKDISVKGGSTLGFSHSNCNL